MEHDMRKTFFWLGVSVVSLMMASSACERHVEDEPYINMNGSLANSRVSRYTIKQIGDVYWFDNENSFFGQWELNGNSFILKPYGYRPSLSPFKHHIKSDCSDAPSDQIVISKKETPHPPFPLLSFIHPNKNPRIFSMYTDGSFCVADYLDNVYVKKDSECVYVEDVYHVSAYHGCVPLEDLPWFVPEIVYDD